MLNTKPKNIIKDGRLNNAIEKLVLFNKKTTLVLNIRLNKIRYILSLKTSDINIVKVAIIDCINFPLEIIIKIIPNITILKIV